MSNPVRKRRGIKIRNRYRKMNEVLKDYLDRDAYYKRIEAEKKEDEKTQAKIENIKEQLEKKLGYGKSDWTPFASALIFELHPDLQFYSHNVKKAGAKLVWDKKLLACLWMDVFDYQRQRPEQSINSIFNNLEKKDFWKKLGKSKAVLNKYYGKRIKPKIDEKGYSSYYAKVVVEFKFFCDEIRSEILKTAKIRHSRGLPKT